MLQAGRDATLEAGLHMPLAEQDMSEMLHDSTSTSFEYEYTNANDDYGIV